MRRVLKWAGRGLLGLVLLLVVALGAVSILGARVVDRQYDVEPMPIAIPTDSAAIAEGERLARTRGCYNGCHGEGAEGEVFFEDRMFGRFVTPDLTRLAHTYGDAELARVIRHGVRPDGRSVMIMPSDMFYQLSDEDVGAIIAFLRSLPLEDGEEGVAEPGVALKAMLAFGAYEPPAAVIDHAEGRLAPGRDDPVALGRYLALTSCTECHGKTLKGSTGPGPKSPSLAIVAAYTPDEFRELLRTGQPRDGRELDLMALVSRKRFSYFTDPEIDGLHAYLATSVTSADPQPRATRE